jgi:glycine/D-amino acid oxidase-like deaminating enzyme
MPSSDDPCFDLVVIGGGILGLTTALIARRDQPEWSILVIDRGMPGGGATRWSAALSVSHAVSPRHRELVQESLARFRQFIDTVKFAEVVPVPAAV